jgi:flagellar assembly protein FliH
MTARAKFLFDTDFGAAETRPTEPTIGLAEHTVRLAEAEAKGYRAGVAAAQAQAAAEAERSTAAALGRAANALEQLRGGLTAVEDRLEREAVEVALAVGQRLAPELIAREPLIEIEALARDCFRHLVAAPHVVVRINDGLQAAVRERLDEISRGHGFEGRLVVLGEPDVALGDCRIEWADGGVERSRAKVEGTIYEAVQRYIKGRRNVAATEPGAK